MREALGANRDLQAARLAIDVARGQRRQAGRLENPELELGYVDDFAFADEGERAASAGFAQRFPVTARLARERDVAGQDVEIAEAEVRNFVRTLIADVEGVFYTVRALDERRATNAELIESVRHVEETTVRRLRAAEVSPAEVGLLRIERLRLEQETQRLLREREVAASSLTRLLGRARSEEISPIGDLDPGPMAGVLVPPVATVAAMDRPDLEGAQRGIERADADLRLARTEIWQDWTVRLGTESDRQVFDAPIGVERDAALGIGLTVPIPLWNRQQGRIAAAAAELRRSRRSRDALVLRIDEEIRAADARVRTLRSSVDAYAEDILPEAKRSQELFERGYRQGLVGIAELLQAQRQYNESRTLYLELLGDLRQAAIALEAATGTSPHLNDLRQPGGMP
ncbi:MAG: TolC family protein [Myxococcota bacterium]|nr:TolC family protein [Myxococcota bacterium]